MTGYIVQTIRHNVLDLTHLHTLPKIYHIQH